jgi:hypothetical protein
MPPLPTLLVPGASAANPGVAPIAHITGWLRQRMPEFGHRGAAMEDRVLVVRAETGSGKSTVLPVAVFRLLRGEKTPAGLKYRGPGVLCTQPRVLTAVALASDVDARHSPWNADIVMGETVGYQTGPISNRPVAGLVYATAGVLAAQLRSLPDVDLMGLYRFIIVDEAHERSLDADMTLMLLRNLMRRNLGNPRLPFVLLTSATFDTGRYADYFGVGPANVVEVTGRAYAIETHWPAAGTNDYTAAAAAAVVRIHEEHAADPPERADVLVFLPGAPEMAPVAAALGAALKAYAAAGWPHPPFLVLSISRDVINTQSGDYPLVFAPPARLPLVDGRRPARRVVLSTVVAETGLTIDTLRHVVDCGWSRTREAYPPWGAEGIVTRPAPQSRIRQRKGRAGRLFDGHFWPLYTENVHAALEAQQLPEIITAGVGEAYLALVAEQQRQKLRDGRLPEFRLEDLGLLDPPPAEAFLEANATAVALGFVSARAALFDAWPPPALTGALPDDAVAPQSAVAPQGAVAPQSTNSQTRRTRGYGLTALGHLGAAFTRCPMEGVRVLLAGYAWGAAAGDLLTAVAMFGQAPADLLAGRGRRKAGTEAGALPPGAEALRAALPAYLVQRGGGGVVLPPLESEEFYYRARLIIADDFAEAALVFAEFARRVDACGGDLGSVAAWCAEVGLAFDALVELGRRRDALAEEMVAAGLSPFRAADRQLARLPLEAFGEGLRRFKRCLYDGLRCRLLRRDRDQGAFFTAQGLRVAVPPLLAEATALRLRAIRVTAPPAGAWQARWVLTDRVRLTPAPRREGDAADPLLYVAEAGLVSVLDGFVDPDLEFAEPRMF